MKRELIGQNCLFHYHPEAFSNLQHVFEKGWSIVRSALLAKGGTSKNRPLLHLHKVPTRSDKVSARTFQMALV
jgi:hypothetical protein